MELTREALAQVKFRTRGQWYDALQVDQFIEELMAAADRQEEESRLLREEWMARLAQATEEAQGLRERLRALERESRGPPRRPGPMGKPEPPGGGAGPAHRGHQALRRSGRASGRRCVRTPRRCWSRRKIWARKICCNTIFISCREARESHGD